jgi:HlyD family secretion protein
LKVLGFALLALILVAGLIAGYRYFTRDNEPTQVAVQRTAMVTRGNLTVTISGTGSIEPVSTATISAGTSGKIAEVLVKEGDTVKEGDVLAVFETSDNTRQIRIKELEIQQSRLDLEQLYEQYKTADEDARQELLLRIERQRLTIQAEEEELADMKENQGPDRIVAPISGKITALNVRAGDSVQANTTVAEIADYTELQITVPIDELDITKVEVGQTATILVDAFGGETFTGKVTEIADQGSYNNGVATFDVTVKIDEPGKIKAGMSAEASIQVASKENVLLLPVDAVRSAGGRYFVIKADGVVSPQAGQAQGFRPPDRQAGGAGAGNAGNAQDRQANSGEQEQPRQQGQGSQGAQAPQGTTGQRGAQGPQGQPGAGAQSQQGAQGAQSQQGQQRQQGGQGAQAPQGQQNLQGRQGAQGPQGAQGSGRVFIEVGISNEDYIEIVSGLSEGDIVILPTVISSASNAQAGFPGGGFSGGFPGGGFPGGGFTGGGPGGGFPGGGARAGGTGGGR